MKLHPSLLSADFSRLVEEAKTVADSSDALHVDVMDGHFVPNITIGPPVVNALRRNLDIPFDIHLMISDPRTYAVRFNVKVSDTISFHIEITAEPTPIIETIRDHGARVGIALNPETPVEAIESVLEAVDQVIVMGVHPGFGGQTIIPSTLEKIAALREAIDQKGLSTEIEVDGGVNLENLEQVLNAGAEVIVAGSAIFASPDRQVTITQFREIAARARVES
ncbi:MAG: ribulose-phosphate 3-epimerase [Candidatus Bipolaricaulia bacterium]